jgi:hypothetical protein
MHALRPEIPLQLDGGHVCSYVATVSIHRGSKKPEIKCMHQYVVHGESQKGNAPVCSR